MRRACVLGGAGFIGHRMAKYLKERGYWVRVVDIKPAPDYEASPANEFLQVDLRDAGACRSIAFGGPDFDEVFSFGAWMGGISFITSHFADLTRNNVAINVNVLESARQVGMGKLFFASSACVYRHDKQARPDVVGLREEDAWPADPEPGYGLEKLFTEELCRFYKQDYNVDVRVARFHNVYGPYGTYEGGREKAPAAVCRKVALARDGDKIEIWGDGKQTRSFIYVDDCVEGVYRLVQLPNDFVWKSPWGGDSWSIGERPLRKDWHPWMPINIGSDRMISVDELVDLTCGIAGKTLAKKYNLEKPQGVRGRNSDNTLMRAVLGWEPKVLLEDGLTQTYAWIAKQLANRGAS